MSIFVKTIRTRLDPLVPFADPELDHLYPSTIADTSEVMISEETSNNGLTKTILRKWRSMNVLNEYLDQVKSSGIAEKEKEYRKRNNITKTVIVTDESGNVIQSFDAND